jgi:hypothetical protein
MFSAYSCGTRWGQLGAEPKQLHQRVCDPHPWEDWAKTFAHFLHIVSTLDSLAGLPLALDDRAKQVLEDPYLEGDFEALLISWKPVARSINELNCSLGLGDAYPFELAPAVIGKLHLVHMAIGHFRDTAPTC